MQFYYNWIRKSKAEREGLENRKERKEKIEMKNDLLKHECKKLLHMQIIIIYLWWWFFYILN